MKIYDSKVAPNPRRVRVFLAEKAIDIPYEEVDIQGAANLTDDFLKKNPMGKVPVLEFDDGSCLSETVAICRYFEEVQPEPPLFGSTPREKADIEMWQRRVEQYLLGSIGNAFRHTSDFFADRMTPIAEWGEFNRGEAEQAFAWLDGILADREFVAGDSISIADITALCAVDFGRIVKVKIKPEQTNLARWHEMMSARPSAVA